MPRFDGTGPSGQGGRTGRGMGRCPPAETIAPEEGAVAGAQENTPNTPANQAGMGRGRGAGMGRGAGRGLNRR